MKLAFGSDEDLAKGKVDYLSIGSKFAFVTLILPIFLTVVVLGGLYFSYTPQPFIIALMAGLLPAETIFSNSLRPTMRDRMVQVWDNYLKPIRNATYNPFDFYGFLSEYSQKELQRKNDLLEKNGKYGPLFRLYPKTLMKNLLVERFILNGRNFHERLDQLVAVAKARDVELKLNYAFSHWGFKHFRDLKPQLSGGERQTQDDCLNDMDRTHRDEVAELKQYQRRVVVISEGIIRILESFAGKNGISVEKTNPLIEQLQSMRWGHKVVP